MASFPAHDTPQGCSFAGRSMLPPSLVGPTQAPLGPGHTLIFFPNPSYYLGNLSLEDILAARTLLFCQKQKTLKLPTSPRRPRPMAWPAAVWGCWLGPAPQARPGLSLCRRGPDPPPPRKRLRTRGKKRGRLFSLGAFAKTRFVLFVLVQFLVLRLCQRSLKPILLAQASRFP